MPAVGAEDVGVQKGVVEAVWVVGGLARSPRRHLEVDIEPAQLGSLQLAQITS